MATKAGWDPTYYTLQGAPKVDRSVCFLLGNAMCPEVESYGALISFKGLVYSQASCQIPHQPIKIKNAKAGEAESGRLMEFVGQLA